MSQNNNEHWIHRTENSPYQVSKPCDKLCKHFKIRWLLAQDTEWYQRRTEELALRFYKCLSCGAECVEMLWVSATVKCEPLLVLEIKLFWNTGNANFFFWPPLGLPVTARALYLNLTSVGHRNNTCHVAARVPRHITSLPQPASGY
jgi:hypothetical protein